MKLVRLCAILTLGVALAFAIAEAGEPKKSRCCAKAEKEGKTCDHVCCIEAAKDDKNCEKCGGKN
ncbi:MAG: hypothetical protein Q8J74_07280 [Candidatus Didemnitutus sp.]|nr:hypothetical protein [Candidatus Didemnitutus sp.]